MPNPEEIRKKTEALEAEEKNSNGHNARRRVATKRSRQHDDAGGQDDPKKKLDRAGNEFVQKRRLRREMVFEVFQTCSDALDKDEPLEVELLPDKLAELEPRATRARRHTRVIDYLLGRRLSDEDLFVLTEREDPALPIHGPLVAAMTATDISESSQPLPELLEALDGLADALEADELPFWFAMTPGGMQLDDLYKPEDPDQLEVKVDAVRSLIELYEEAEKLEINLPRSKKVLGARVRRYLTPTRKDSKNFG